MSALAPSLEAFFTERLMHQRHASPNTVAAYRDAWRLLLGFASQRTAKQPSQLDVADLDAPLIGEFLQHLETERHNSARTRNARLAAVRSFFRFAALRHPEHAAVIARVLAIPTKRCDRAEVCYLTEPEADAVVASPDQQTWTGRRDHAVLAMAVQTGLRVSELTGLRNQDVELRTGAHVRCWGKGRKERATPLRPRTAEAPASAQTRWRHSSKSTPPPRPAANRRCATRTSRRTCCGTRARWLSAVAGSTEPSSLSGSVTSKSRRPTSTCTPISRSRSRPSLAPGRRTSVSDATGRPTDCSPSFSRSDYADRKATDCTATTHTEASIHIIPLSA